MNLAAWNTGCILAFLALGVWWNAYGQKLWELRGQRCGDCKRPRVNCSCVDVIFTPDDLWGDDDE